MHPTLMGQILFLSIFFTLLLVPCLAQDKSVNDFALTNRKQCQDTASRESVFDSVSIEYKEKLNERFEEFLRYKCEEDFGNLYKILVTSFRELNNKNEYVKDMEFYYEGEDKFISFVLTDISESISPLTNKADVWFIEGCLTEKIRGKNRSVKTILEAILETRKDKEDIYFTDITTRPNPLGENHKCNS